MTLKHLGLWDLKVRSQPKVKLPSITISIDDSDFQNPFSAPSLLCGTDIPDGLQQGFEATLGDSDGYGFCYKPSPFQSSKMFGFDFHTYLTEMMVSNGNLQFLWHALSKDK